MYDHNGLELTKVSNTMNTYRLTAVDLTQEKFCAYARSKSNHKNDWSMHTIGLYTDPRDAAYVSQEFERLYTKEQVKEMILDKTFSEIARDFRKNIDIPEWKFPAEGYTIQELINGGFDTYKTNYMNNARDAIREAIRVNGLVVPAIAKAKKLIAKVEELYNQGFTYRAAAQQILG